MRHLHIPSSSARAVDKKKVTSDWLNGNWHKQLPTQAYQFASANPTANNLYLALKIQHAIAGLCPNVLRETELQLSTLSSDSRWSKLTLRLLCAYLQTKQVDRAHLLVEDYLQDRISIYDRRRLRRFPLALHFLHEHYPEKLGPQLTDIARTAVSMFSMAKTINQGFFKGLFEDVLLGGNHGLRIAIVGNGPSLLDTSSGAAIDSHDLVVRFNSPVLTPQYHAHTGQRTDMCIVSPAMAKRPSYPQIKAMAISGINIMAGESGYWQSLAAHSARLPMAVFSQEHWYSLVAQLQAPPSAGLLTLTSLANTQDLEIAAFGFSSAASKVSTHTGSVDESVRPGAHYGDNNAASSRHNWPAEAKLLQQITQTTSITPSSEQH